jgi:tryptophan synthase beta chain
MSDQTRFTLNETDLPKNWYNVLAESPVPPQPVLHPATMEPVTPDFLSVLFPMEIIMQDVSTERYIEIPEPVREIYKLSPHTARPGAAFGADAGHTCAHLFQE